MRPYINFGGAVAGIIFGLVAGGAMMYMVMTQYERPTLPPNPNAPTENINQPDLLPAPELPAPSTIPTVDPLALADIVQHLRPKIVHQDESQLLVDIFSHRPASQTFAERDTSGRWIVYRLITVRDTLAAGVAPPESLVIGIEANVLHSLEQWLK